MADKTPNVSESSSNDDANIPLFTCKHCPGKTFELEELDAHRAFHRFQRKSVRFSQKRGREQTQGPEVPADSGDANKDEMVATNPPKRRSKKKYNGKMIEKWQRGQGA